MQLIIRTDCLKNNKLAHMSVHQDFERMSCQPFSHFPEPNDINLSVIMNTSLRLLFN